MFMMQGGWPKSMIKIQTFGMKMSITIYLINPNRNTTKIPLLNMAIAVVLRLITLFTISLNATIIIKIQLFNNLLSPILFFDSL